MGSSSGRQELFTLFVDNIPDHSSQPWLRKLFNNYGVVKDVFIPVKRSKATGCKFGFIRYDCHVSAGVAIQEVHGLKVGDKKLFVKFASFRKSEERKNNRKTWKPIGVPESSKQGNDRRQENFGFRVVEGKSYAQAVIGEETHGRVEEEGTFRKIASSSPSTVFEMEAEKMDEDLDRKHDDIEEDSEDLEAGNEREKEDQHSHVPKVALETDEGTNETREELAQPKANTFWGKKGGLLSPWVDRKQYFQHDRNQVVKASQSKLKGEVFTDAVGSPFYVAPEVLPKHYGPEADV
ncbi:hypothetical protein Vadar_002571 [Vaccinium darrowii]|uniref:Uncharacterized protein n=1 Tax=Vaccinium darrowii TaxID=229202 RepID=A0ACB7YSJ1_9ERIC|nr:hypothetical protein Vadar_002571 [Vaccinium darrowii]